MNNPIITGSIAYDKIYEITEDFSSKFPRPDVKQFTMPYLACNLKQHFGGCASNIAYALKKIGVTSTIMGTVGQNFGLYRDYLEALGISTEHILEIQNTNTAEAVIFNDPSSNQFIAFYPGACAEASKIDVTAALPAPIAIVSANAKDGMMRYCRDFYSRKTPFIFDPGQILSSFTKEECIECIEYASYLIVNHDEFALLKKITGMDTRLLRKKLGAVIVTSGAFGSRIYSKEIHNIHAFPVNKVLDTTGCGDAYRAGLIHGLLQGWDWGRIGIFSSVMGGMKSEHFGAQGYELSHEMVEYECQPHKVKKWV